MMMNRELNSAMIVSIGYNCLTELTLSPSHLKWRLENKLDFL